MNYKIPERAGALSDPSIRANVLAKVREAVRETYRDMELLRHQMERLDADLQSPHWYLYANGSCEIVTPAIGSNIAITLEWEDLTVQLVAERGTSDLNAGEIVWEHV